MPLPATFPSSRCFNSFGALVFAFLTRAMASIPLILPPQSKRMLEGGWIAYGLMASWHPFRVCKAATIEMVRSQGGIVGYTVEKAEAGAGR